MYASNQRVLANLGKRRGMRGLRGLGAAATAGAVGAAAGTVVPGVGTAVGGVVGSIIGSLFGGAHYTGPTVQAGFMTWFQQGPGSVGWTTLQQIADTGQGPPWPGNTGEKSSTLTYGGTIAPGSGGLPANVPPTTMTTPQFAGWLVAQGQATLNAAQQAAQSTAATLVIPPAPAVGLTNPVTVTVPASAARTGSVTSIPTEVTAVLTHMSQGQNLVQAIQTAVSLGEVNAADAAAVQTLASQAKSGATTTTYGASTGLSLGSLGSVSPVVLLGGLAVVALLMMKRKG
jgi:hypothetical protein